MSHWDRDPVTGQLIPTGGCPTDSQNQTVTFTSSDVPDADASAWTSVTPIASGEQHKSLFAKISQMFKNVRYLFKLLGTTDVSSFFGGSNQDITGALSTLNDHIGSHTVETDVPSGAEFTDTTYSVVSKTANGLAPQLPNEDTTTKYLRQDGTWQVPPDNNTTYSIDTGDSAGQIKVTPSSGSAYNVLVKNVVKHLGNADKSNMNDVGRLYPSVGMTNLTDPGNTTDNPINGTTKSTGWHLYWDASYGDDPNGANAWVAQIANRAGTHCWWVRSRSGGKTTNGTAWASPWAHMVVANQAGVGNAKTPVYVDGNGAVQTTNMKSLMLDICYPVGSIYMSTKNVSPATFLGGTWKVHTGYFLRASKSGVVFNSAANNGGSDTYTLQPIDIPKHSHQEIYTWSGASNIGGNWKTNMTNTVYGGAGTWTHTSGLSTDVSLFGGGGAHNNVPLYKNVYCWERTA